MRLVIVRRSWLIAGIAILLAMLALAFGRIGRGYIQTMNVPSIQKVIVIDPGHGGNDPGAVSKSGIKEKDVNLKIALYLREYLEQSGSIVILTRDKDIALYQGNVRNKKREDLKNRKNIVRQSNGDLFISIHLNSFPQAQYYGAQTFFSKDNPHGKIAAQLIQEELRNTLDSGNQRTSLPKDDVYIINDLPIPAVLVECGFLSNAEEAKLLNESKYQRRLAWAIYTGIQRFFSRELE